MVGGDVAMCLVLPCAFLIPTDEENNYGPPIAVYDATLVVGETPQADVNEMSQLLAVSECRGISDGSICSTDGRRNAFG